MNAKPQPNRERYADALRRMTPTQRWRKAFELTEMSRAVMRAGLRRRHPDATDAELHRMFLEALARCHNRNY